MKSAGITVGIALCFLLGCGVYRRNDPLTSHTVAAENGYRYINLTQTPANNGEKNFIIVTMSGGGSRAAASF